MYFFILPHPAIFKQILLKINKIVISNARYVKQTYKYLWHYGSRISNNALNLYYIAKLPE